MFVRTFIKKVSESKRKMFPKTEPAENIPKSTPPPSMDSIVRDLRSLEKYFISSKERGQNQLNIMQTKVKRLEFENSAAKSELEDMKSKISLLEDQNSKLKSDLKASDLNENLYYNQCEENGRMVRELEAENASFTININKLKKEVQELKLKNKFLKAEMKLLRTSKLESEISKSENSDGSNRSTNVNKSGDSVSADPDITHFGDVVDEAPEWTRSKLSADDETSNEASNDELHKTMQEQKSSRQQKRKSRSEDESENLPKSKKPCPAPIDPLWNCGLCFGRWKFNTKTELKDHIKLEHPLRNKFCLRCPYTASKRSNLRKHVKLHAINEQRFKDTENADHCNLCHVWFPPGSALTNHNILYHSPNPKKNYNADLNTSSDDKNLDDPRYNLRERKGNVIKEILERKFFPLPPPTFCAFEIKYLIKWKESKYGLALDDTWERKEDITKELKEFWQKHFSKRIETILAMEKETKLILHRKPEFEPCD